MLKFLPRFRYYLELISVPVFAFLVLHLGGHGLMLLKDSEHDHSDHDDHGHGAHEGESGHAEHGFSLDLDFLLSTETLGGLLLLMAFVWCWHRPQLKKLVPCSHDHCHHKTAWPHLLASAAFVFHFFPESTIRHDIIQDLSLDSAISLAGAIGFLSHFFVDIIIMVLLSLFWEKSWQKLLSLGTIIAFWIWSFVIGASGGFHIEGMSEAVILILSAFLLAMFIHYPHKPVIEKCSTCG